MTRQRMKVPILTQMGNIHVSFKPLVEEIKKSLLGAIDKVKFSSWRNMLTHSFDHLPPSGRGIERPLLGLWGQHFSCC